MAPAMVSQSKSSNKRSFRWRTLRLSVTGCLSSNRLRSMIIVQFHLVEHSCCNLFFVKFKHSLVNVAVATVLWLKKETIARQRSRICIRSALLSIASLTAKLRVWAMHDTRNPFASFNDRLFYVWRIVSYYSNYFCANSPEICNCE